MHLVCGRRHVTEKTCRIATILSFIIVGLFGIIGLILMGMGVHSSTAGMQLVGFIFLVIGLVLLGVSLCIQWGHTEYNYDETIL